MLNRLNNLNIVHSIFEFRVDVLHSLVKINLTRRRIMFYPWLYTLFLFEWLYMHYNYLPTMYDYAMSSVDQFTVVQVYLLSVYKLIKSATRIVCTYRHTQIGIMRRLVIYRVVFEDDYHEQPFNQEADVFSYGACMILQECVLILSYETSESGWKRNRAY